MDTKEIISQLKSAIDRAKLEAVTEEVGRVLMVKDGIVRISGLAHVGYAEMLEIRARATAESRSADLPIIRSAAIMAMALNLAAEEVGAIVLGDWTSVREGDEVVGTGNVLSIPVGEHFVGRVVNPLGEPLDGKGPIASETRNPLERIAPGVVYRKSVDTPLETGIKAIDAMIPIGRGQRELIIGDRQTGKTAIGIDAIINQKGKGVICVYVAVSQKLSKIAKIATELEKHGAMEHTIIVVAGASDPAPLSYIAPYAGCAMGEYFMDKGQDALVVYDDLTKHAWAYREVSLLLERPPGREAYPGDVFYLHSRLLERAARMAPQSGGGSLTALPIIETQAGDVSAYIPTNVISITDGQIYLESDLFYKGIRPALNVGLSVSRVGSAAQTKAMKKVAGRLRLDLAQFRELEVFAQFAQDLDEATKRQIDRGKRLVELLKQTQYEPLPMAEQVAVLYAAVNGYLDDVSVEKIKEWETRFLETAKVKYPEFFEKLERTKELTEELEQKLIEICRNSVEVYRSEAVSS